VNEEAGNKKNPTLQVEDEQLPDPLDYMPKLESKMSRKQSVMNIDDEQEYKDRMAEANERLKLEEDEQEERMKGINDPSKQKSTLASKLLPFNKPLGAVAVGIIFASFTGFMAPMCGTLMMAVTFGMYVPDDVGVKETVDPFTRGMFLLAILMFFFKTLQRLSFNLVGENMTIQIRKALYLTFLRKHVGWHDDKENASGVLSAMLAGDV